MFGRKKSRENVDQGADSSGEFLGEGPHDRKDVADIAEYYNLMEFGYLDLGAMVFGMPRGWDLNLTLSPQGSPEFHIVSKNARIVPHVYSAPKSPGQWRNWVPDLKTNLEAQKAKVTIEDGYFGRELLAELPAAMLRVAGVDGPRWMAEVRIISSSENAELAAEEGREILRHMIVERDTEPMPVREHLPLNIPPEMQKALAQAQQKMAAQQKAKQQEGQTRQAPQPPQASAQPPQQTRPARGDSAMDGLRQNRNQEI